jgi:MscS family membrane protein
VIAGTISVRRHAKWLRSAGLIVLLLCVANTAGATDIHPLRPPDTSSPRATLQGFIETTDDVYRRMAEVLDSYGRSARLYTSAEERRKQSEALEDALKLGQYFDVSAIAPVLRDTVKGERILQLKEVLDRIEVPAAADTPDREAIETMEAAGNGDRLRSGRARAARGRISGFCRQSIAFQSSTRG